MIHETDTEYQYARVVEDADGERTLELNEGQAVHSVYRPGTRADRRLLGRLPRRSVRRRGREPPRRMAILGNAAGTTARAYGRYFPDTRDRRRRDRRRAVRHRAPLLRPARPRRGCALHTEDARPFLRRTDARYDAIFVDAYRQPYIPFYLATKEFFELARDRLTPGGVVLINVGHPEGSTQLEKVLTATMGAAFRARRARPGRGHEHAADRRPSAALGRDALRAAAATLPADLRPLALRRRARSRPRCAAAPSTPTTRRRSSG